MKIHTEAHHHAVTIVFGRGRYETDTVHREKHHHHEYGEGGPAHRDPHYQRLMAHLIPYLTEISSHILFVRLIGFIQIIWRPSRK